MTGRPITDKRRAPILSPHGRCRVTEDRERLRSDYATALTAHFGDRALTIARAQMASATGNALEEWTALVALLEIRVAENG